MPKQPKVRPHRDGKDHRRAMKNVYLLRHAKASADSPTFDDRDRPLNARGHDDAPLIAREMKVRGHVPDLILCSSARRTQDTCRHVLETLGPEIQADFDPALYLADDNEILEAIHSADPSAAAVLVIGHNPGLEELAASLGKDGGPGSFPTAALAVFRFDVADWSQVRRKGGAFADFLTPKMLKD